MLFDEGTSRTLGDPLFGLSLTKRNCSPPQNHPHSRKDRNQNVIYSETKKEGEGGVHEQFLADNGLRRVP